MDLPSLVATVLTMVLGQVETFRVPDPFYPDCYYGTVPDCVLVEYVAATDTVTVPVCMVYADEVGINSGILSLNDIPKGMKLCYRI